MPDSDIYNEVAGLLRNRQPTLASPLFSSAPEKTAAAISVYRNNVRASLSKALAEKFPVIVQLVGEDFFKATAQEYFNEYPPTSPLIADYGNDFPIFLDAFDPVQNLPYLADMARLEIAWLGAYRAADAVALEPDTIMAASGGDPSQLTFTPHPSLRLLRSNFAVGSIWRRHQQNSSETKINAGIGECIMIARPARDVKVNIISNGAFIALTHLTTGKTVSAAFEHAFNNDVEFDPQEMFQLIFNSGVIIAANLQGTE